MVHLIDGYRVKLIKDLKVKGTRVTLMRLTFMGDLQSACHSCSEQVKSGKEGDATADGS